MDPIRIISGVSYLRKGRACNITWRSTATADDIVKVIQNLCSEKFELCIASEKALFISVK